MTQYEKGLIEKLNLLIENKYINSESITDDLCHELGVSRSNLYRILKDNFQLSPSLYIRKIKLKKAKNLLKTTDMKISEIAYFIGLDSPQNFTKYFTQEHGLNPTDYRKSKIESKTEPIPQEAEATYKPIIKQKPKFKEKISFFIPGLVVSVLTALGFYFWQKNYIKDAPGAYQTTKYSIAMMPFDCEISLKNGLCDSVYHLFTNKFAQNPKISLLEKSLFQKVGSSGTSEAQPNNEFEILYLLSGKVVEKKNQLSIYVELLDAKVEHVIFAKLFTLNKNTFEPEIKLIIEEMAEILSQNTQTAQIKKLYLLPTKNMITYKQYLQGSQLIFDWPTLK